MRAALVSTCLLALALALAPAVRADDKTAAAVEAFEQGKRAYHDGRYEDAVLYAMLASDWPAVPRDATGNA